MKTIKYLFSLVALLTIFACSSEQEVYEVQGTATLQLQVQVDGTRAGIDDTKFAKYDSIGLFIPELNLYNVAATTKDGVNWTTSEDIKVGASDVHVFAYYPYQYGAEKSYKLDLRTQALWLVTEKPATVNSATPTAVLSFTHQQSRIRLEITNHNENARLQSVQVKGDKIVDNASYNVLTNSLSGMTFNGFTVAASGSRYSQTGGDARIDMLLAPIYELGSGSNDAQITLNYEGGKTYSTTITLNEKLWKSDYCIYPITIGEKNMHYGHEYVDMGLPSGTLWATCNLGAASPAEVGESYAWGETEPKSTFSWENYKWGTQSAPTKYNAKDKKTVLDAEDDAAHVAWGGNWRIPTSANVQELFNNCTVTWEEGRAILTSTKTKNSIVIPISASGYSELWTSTLNSSSSSTAMEMCFYSPEVFPFDPPYFVGKKDNNRKSGYPIRPVCSK